ncbi:hypothetical protein GGI12_005639, partial [Dipsacomyces acuminosporus]
MGRAESSASKVDCLFMLLVALPALEEVTDLLDIHLVELSVGLVDAGDEGALAPVLGLELELGAGIDAAVTGDELAAVQEEGVCDEVVDGVHQDAADVKAADSDQEAGVESELAAVEAGVVGDGVVDDVHQDADDETTASDQEETADNELDANHEGADDEGLVDVHIDAVDDGEVVDGNSAVGGIVVGDMLAVVTADAVDSRVVDVVVNMDDDGHSSALNVPPANDPKS